MSECWTCDELRAEVERLRDKAIRFDLDQAGITQREKEAVELVELRAEVERLREEILKAEADIRALGFEAHPTVVMRMDRLVRTSRAALAPEVKP